MVVGPQQPSMIDIRVRLKRAILNDDLLVVKRLCTENPSCMNYCDKEEKGNTPLHIAAEKGLYNIVVLLCVSGHEDKGISRNYEGQTPLMVASGSTHSSADDVVFYLVNEYPKCVNWREKSGMTALMMAARVGNDANVNVLLESDADINSFDPLGNTALHYASAYGQLKAMRSLISRGANYEHRNREGWDAKDYSYTKQAEQYFKQLVEGAVERVINNNPAAMSMASMQADIRSAPGSRDGKRPGTAGSFSYGSNQLPSGSTITLVPSNPTTSGSGGTPVMMPAPSSGGGTPSEELSLPRVLKSAASMVEFSHTDRGSVSSQASGSTFGSMSSAQGGGIGFSNASTQQNPQQHLPQGQNSRNLFDPFTPLRPRASSGG